MKMVDVVVLLGA